MSNFVNTVDIVGDEALTNSILDRSITEIADNVSKKVGSNAFYNCKNLVVAKFPNATNLVAHAFRNCSSLTTADFSVVTNIEQYAFNGCSSLTALILRGETVCTFGDYVFTSTPIDSPSKEGYIYVPRDLVDSYKADSKWSTYASKIRAIEDYPEICDPYSWEAVSYHVENGTYKDVYEIGDTVPLDLGSEGVINMQIAAFDSGTLADGSGTAAIRWEAEELLNTPHVMNTLPVQTVSDGVYQEGTGVIGGWEKCEMREYLNTTIKPLIPEVVRSHIVAVNRTQTAYDTSRTKYTQTTVDELWIPIGGGAKKTVSGSARAWYTRNAHNQYFFSEVTTSGRVDNSATMDARHICLGFCTGVTPT